jgi:hypothetical protein
MITLEMRDKNLKFRFIEVFHVWELDPNDVIHDAYEVDKSHSKKKYYHYDDGSDWCALILSVAILGFSTTLNCVRRDDFVHSTWIHLPGSMYTGVTRMEEHYLVRQYTRRERYMSDMIIAGQANPSSPRMQVLVMEKLRNAMEMKGLDEDYVINKLMAAAEKGNEKIKAITILARILGVELVTPSNPNRGGGSGNTYNNLTIQDQRRNGGQIEQMPDPNEIRGVVAKVTSMLDG